MTGTRYFRATLTILTTSSVEVGYTTTLCGNPAHNQCHGRSSIAGNAKSKAAPG